VAVALGITAGLSGMMHGIYEMLQGSTRPEGLVIASIGPPCDPALAWNACEPAMTIVPNFLITGILATLIGLLIVLWSARFIQRRRGGLVLILLSVLLLLFGGGFFPPLIGILGGVAGTTINRPLPVAGGRITLFLAALWPWPLILLLVWLGGQIVVGHFFNDFLQRVMILGVLLILTMLPLSMVSGYAADVVYQTKRA
jgi:hypothetical protein